MKARILCFKLHRSLFLVMDIFAWYDFVLQGHYVKIGLWDSHVLGARLMALDWDIAHKIPDCLKSTAQNPPGNIGSSRQFKHNQRGELRANADLPRVVLCFPLQSS